MSRCLHPSGDCPSAPLRDGWCARQHVHLATYGTPGDVLWLYGEQRVEHVPDPCDVDGCRRDAHSRGWCKKHYQRWLNHRDPARTTPRDRRRAVAKHGRDIVSQVAEQAGVSDDALRTGLRAAPHLTPVVVEAAVRCREAGLSYPQIGRLLGRDHSTVMHLLGKYAPEAMGRAA